MAIISNTYEQYIKLAIRQLKEGSYAQAEENIKRAMFVDPHLPEAHNLYGIFEEFRANNDLARKHYRAACALDSTFQPAYRNLERITMFYMNDKKVDYGDGPERKVKNPQVTAQDNPVECVRESEME